MGTRIVTAVAALVSAYVHLKLWLDGMRDVDVVGPAFMLNAVAGLVIAVLLLTWRHWVPGFLAAGFGASTLGAFILSTTVGPVRRRRSSGSAATCGQPPSPRPCASWAACS